MTRFARKAGLAEKKENTRKIEEATKWNEMFKKDGSGVNEDPRDLEVEADKIKRHENDYNERIELENINSSTKKKKKNSVKSHTKEQHEALLKKYSETIDKEVP